MGKLNAKARERRNKLKELLAKIRKMRKAVEKVRVRGLEEIAEANVANSDDIEQAQEKLREVERLITKMEWKIEDAE